jgi:hypothetical protein
MKLYFILSLIIITINFNASAKSSLYQEIDNSDWFQYIKLGTSVGAPTQSEASALLEKLFIQTSEGHQVLGYENARHALLGNIYLQKIADTYIVKDVYCEKEFTNSDFPSGSGIGPNQVPDNAILNVEHTWPQSRFTRRFPKDTQKSDLHHLYPSDSVMNSLRGNYKFAEVDNSKSSIKCPISNLGKVNGNYRFEPPKAHKGHVARSLFYFSVRYKIHIDADEEAYLRKWNAEDPVDEQEKQHHEIIANLQGNRNPFIDDPQLANQVSDF